ncbi:MAG: hypothetical protein EOP82_29300 [Variovorax sp.]|nr:MAG: hypothetical protein EOP82_29300 [Variovorax sp.]
MVVGTASEYLRRHLAPRHPDELIRHNCIRFRFAATGAMVEYEIHGNLTISDTLFCIDAALEGVGLAYTFEQLARPYIRAKRLRQVLTSSRRPSRASTCTTPAGTISRRS